VGLHNYKFFLIFLFWVSITAALYGILTGSAMFKSYKSFGSMIGAWTVLSLFITCSFALSVGGFFFFHVHLLRQNKTTLENMKFKHQSTPFQRKLGKDNFNDIFGDAWYLWFIPTVTLKETGYELYSNGVAASLIQNEYNTSTVHSNTTEHADDAKGSETSTESNGVMEEVDPKVINQKPFDIGTSTQPQYRGPDGV